MMSYPKWKYHKDGVAKIVHSHAEESTIGLGWVEVNAGVDPADVAKAQAVAIKALLDAAKKSEPVEEEKAEPIEKPKPVAKKKTKKKTKK